MMSSRDGTSGIWIEMVIERDVNPPIQLSDVRSYIAWFIL